MVMDLKDIQQKLKELRDRIKAEGRISDADENELRALLNDTLATANEELVNLQDKLSATLAVRAGNDNILTPEQKKRLSIVEKTGTGSEMVH